MTRKIVIAVLACAIVLTLSAGYAFAYTAYSYGTDYGDGVNTKASAQNTANTLTNMGYSSYFRPDRSASDAWNDLPNAQIFFFNGHAGPGAAEFKSSGQYSYLTDKTSIPSWSYYAINWTSGQLNDMALMAFVACNSANTGNDGNLLDAATTHGVDTALGFSTTIDSVKCGYWEERFAAHLDEQRPISTAASMAAADTSGHYWPWGNGGTGNYVIKGSLGLTVDPARAGY